MLDVGRDNAYRANLTFLRERVPVFLRPTFDAAKEETAEISIETSDAGTVSVIARRPDGGRVQLHSARDPLGEAERQIAAWEEKARPARDGLIIVLGFGGAYHLEALIAWARPGATILALDTNPAAVKTVARHRDLATALSRRSDIALLLGFSENVQELGRLFRSTLTARNDFDFHLFSAPGYRRAFPERHAAMEQAVRSEMRLECMDRGTIAYLSRSWTRNCLQNAPAILSAPSIDILKDHFLDRPAVVIAAGPSLDRTLSAAREIAPRALTIAVGTALKPVLRAGLVPDLTIALDWDGKSWAQFSGVDPGRIRLLTESVTYPEIPALFSGKLFSFSSNALEEYNQWLASFGALPAALAVGGTVTLSAVDAAVYMGCDPILTFGLDLACADDGASHAAGSMYDGVRHSRGGLVAVPGNFSENVYTTPQFARYIDMFRTYIERLAQSRAVRLYNINTAGAKIPGVPAVLPENAATLVTGPRVDAKSILDDAYNAGGRPDPKAVLEAIDALLPAMKAIHSEASRAVALCDRQLANNVIDADALTELDSVDRKLKENSRALCLVNGAIKSVCMHLLGQSGAAAPSPERAVENSRALYAHVSAAAAWISTTLNSLRVSYRQRTL